MSGEELYNLMVTVQTKVYGLMVSFPPYHQSPAETQIVFEAVVQEIMKQQAGAPTSAAGAITDDSIGALGWDEQQRLYERLYTIGHRIR